MKLIIEVEGGAITNVYCSEPEGVELVVRDFDNIEMGDDDPLELRPELHVIRNPRFALY